MASVVMAQPAAASDRRLSIVLGHLSTSPHTGAWSNSSCAAVGKVNRREANWGGNIRYGASRSLMPRSLQELRDVVEKSPGPIRVVGRGHSFSPVSQVVDGTLISLMQYSDIVSFIPPSPDRPGGFGAVTFQGGATLTDLCEFLAEQSPPAALRQLPSPLFVTAVGACTTGTHGSGPRNLPLSSHVIDIDIVTADGSVVRYDRATTPDELRGAVVASGCLGVVSQMTMEVVPWFDVAVYRHFIPLEMLLDHWGDVYEDRKLQCDSCSSWVNWHARAGMVTTRHFNPHYDASIAAEPPRWGEHPWSITAKRWLLLAERHTTLSETACSVGVALRDGNIVDAVAANSLAAGAGVAQGWLLVSLGEGPAPVGAKGFSEDGMQSIGGKVSAAAAFDAMPPVDLTGPFNPGRHPKVQFIFENPSISKGATHQAWYGPWHDNLPVWPLGQACAPGPECEYGNQAEYFVPAEHGVAAIRAACDAMKDWSFCDQDNQPITEVGIGENGYDLSNTGFLGIAELRCVKADDAWLSPCRDRDTVSMHISFSGHPDKLEETERELINLEKALEPFQARFHWGKLHTSEFYAPKLESLYGDGLLKFRNLARKLDPNGKFQNKWSKELIFTK